MWNQKEQTYTLEQVYQVAQFLGEGVDAQTSKIDQLTRLVKTLSVALALSIIVLALLVII